jgi:two-component system, OmpR family, response regulator CpxR
MDGPPRRFENCSAHRLLVVDDDADIREMVRDYLSGEGYSVESVANGREAVARVASREFSLVILDVMLPGMSGFEVLRSIRERSQVPVLMLTARGEIVDRVVGLQLGADDYVAKPFSPQELAARIAAILRRASSKKEPENSSLIEVGDITMDTKTRVVECGKKILELTCVEFDLLHLLLRHAGDVVSRETLQREILEREYSPFDRSIDTHVSNLRRKLGPAERGLERIKAIRGTGYLYAPLASRKV